MQAYQRSECRFVSRTKREYLLVISRVRHDRPIQLSDETEARATFERRESVAISARVRNVARDARVEATIVAQWIRAETVSLEEVLVRLCGGTSPRAADELRVRAVAVVVTQLTA